MLMGNLCERRNQRLTPKSFISGHRVVAGGMKGTSEKEHFGADRRKGGIKSLDFRQAKSGMSTQTLEERSEFMPRVRARDLNKPGG